jgi:hypothetical protein
MFKEFVAGVNANKYQLSHEPVTLRMPLHLRERISDGGFNQANYDAKVVPIRERIKQLFQAEGIVCEAITCRLTMPARQALKRRNSDFKIMVNDYVFFRVAVPKEFAAETGVIGFEEYLYVHFFADKAKKTDTPVNIVVTNTSCVTDRRSIYNHVVADNCSMTAGDCIISRYDEENKKIDLAECVSAVVLYGKALKELAEEYTKSLRKSKLGLVKIFGIVNAIGVKFEGEANRTRDRDIKELSSYYGMTYIKRVNALEVYMTFKASGNDGLADTVIISIGYGVPNETYRRNNMTLSLAISDSNVTEVSSTIHDAAESIARAVSLIAPI